LAKPVYMEAVGFGRLWW